MPRVLLVAQETGGVGKSTVTRGLAEAIEGVPIIEIESVHRLTEFTLAKGDNEAGTVHTSRCAPAAPRSRRAAVRRRGPSSIR